MRIGVIGPVGGDQLAENIADALRRMGHAVTQLGPPHASHRDRRVRNIAMLARMAFPSVDTKAQLSLARTAIDEGCELIINVDPRIMPDVISRMQREGMRTACWFTDTVSHLARQLILLAPYDAFFFSEPHLVDTMRANLGLPAHHLPEACNPRWQRPIGPAGTEAHLVVPGSMYPYRVRIVERLINKGIPIKIYGVGVPGWIGDTPTRTAYTGRYVSREERSKIYRSAAGVLNTMHPAEISGLNGRLFQAASSGAAVLSEFRPTLPDAFDIGGEVLAFRDFDELFDEASRLLNEKGLTARLGDAAAKRAHGEHSFDKRLAVLLEKLS
jgi:spore maturation protein CgeB